ncbi:MAG TPA: TIGR02996 domain-containing protein [Gemmataceae bacterium]|nr:TIGR02996 domain-containing protein [Gemmataceae bacterium]
MFSSLVTRYSLLRKAFYTSDMGPEEAAFLDRVSADPDDDAPRLIFADWLDERGDPRGEFIRVQVALARLPADDPRAAGLKDREAILLARYHAHWSEPLKGVAGWTEFRRGFVETVNIETRTFLRRADDLFRLAPVRHVRLLDVGSSLPRLADCPQLARLSALTIYAQHIDERLTRVLAESPHLGGLRALNMGRNRIGDRGAERVAWSPRFRNLIDLDLSDNALGDTGVAAIAGSSNLARLETLVLRRNEVTRVGLGHVCASPALARLRHLGLALNYVGAPQEWNPPRAGTVALSSLDLCENGLTEDGAGVIAALPGLGELARLNLGHNEIGNAGAAVLSRWTGTSNLRVLTLPANRIGDEGARALARSAYLPELTDLDLSENPIHDPGALALFHTTSLPRLRRLGLPRLGLTPQTVRVLARRFGGW